MKRRLPRRILRARRLTDTALMLGGPAGPAPNYAPLLAELARRIEGQLEPGVHRVNIYHDDGCAAPRGGVCRCNCEVRLVEPDPTAN